MGETTKIEWADSTLNLWFGCTKVSPACDHCYAEAWGKRSGLVDWGPHALRVQAKHWRAQLATISRKALKAGRPWFVFVNSLSDFFDNAAPDAWRCEAFEAFGGHPHLTILLLTKRSGNIVDMVNAAGGLPPNVALGSTLANQEEYDRDAGKLYVAGKFTNALFTFGSFEPLLGPVMLDDYAPDWIIVGGESGAHAREMKPEWPRSLHRQSIELGRVFNFKQNGGRTPDKGGHLLDGRAYLDRPKVAA